MNKTFPPTTDSAPQASYALQLASHGVFVSDTEARNLEPLALAKALYPSTSFDTALPSEWLAACLANGFDPRGRVVWGYLAGSLFGQPLPLTLEAVLGLAALTRELP